MDYTPPTPVSPNSRPASVTNSPYTTYTRPNHHRKRISALRLSSDTTSTLPEYIPTNPNSASVTSWRTVPEVTEIDDAPPDYSSDSAQEADEDTDINDQDRRRQAQRSVYVTVGINSAPHSASVSTFTSPPTRSSSRLKRVPLHKRKRSNTSLSQNPRSNSDLYLDSLLERSVHALEMSNALLQSSITTKSTLSGILNQESDEEDNFPSRTHSAMSPRQGPGSGMYSLERSAQGLSSRIMSNRDVHETWVEDLEQISRDVENLFSEDPQERRHARRSGSGSSQGSISASVPVASSPLQTYRHQSNAGPSQQRPSRPATRRASLDLGSKSHAQSTLSLHSEHSERHDEMAGVPHLRYDVQDRKRFISHPPRALTQYVVVEGDLRHGHEDIGKPHHHRPTHSTDLRRNHSSTARDDDGHGGRNIGGHGRDSRSGHYQEPETQNDDDDETIALPSTLGLRSSGTYSTVRRSSRSRSPSPAQTASRFIHHHHRERESNSKPSSSLAPPPDTPPSSSSHHPTRAPNAYNMLSSFVYPASTPSSPKAKRSNSTSAASRGKTKSSPLGSRRGSTNSATERPVFGSRPSRQNGNVILKRRHSTSPAASTASGSSSTVTAGSASRSRSQTPKPLGPGFTLTPPNSTGRRNMTPPLEVSSSGGEWEGRSSIEGEGSEESTDSCPTKQTILSLRKILDSNPPPKPSSDDWTFISKPPRLLQESLKVGAPVEAGTSTATASISKLFTRGVHSHQGSVTRQQIGEQRTSSFKGKGRASASNSVGPSAPATPTTISPAPTPSRSTFGKLPEFLGSSVALALGGAPSPLSSKPSSGTSTPATPSYSKRISFAELPEGTQGKGAERKGGRKRKGKQRASANSDAKGSGRRRSNRRKNENGSDDEGGEGDGPKGWLGWLVGLSVVDGGRSDKVEERFGERLGKGWGGLSAASRSGYGGGLDEWGI